LDNNYYNATPKSGGSAALFPAIVDPQTIGLNRLQLQYQGIAGTVVTVGRQRINFDDERFVGSAGWRDNEQTFDAVRIESMPIKHLKADITYAWDDNTVFGIDGQTGVGTGHIQGDNVFGTLGYTTPVGTLEGFGYVVNQTALTRAKFSSATFGGRFAGKYAFNRATNISYTVAYANQRDDKLAPTRFSTSYYFGEAYLNSHGWSAGGGYELLGADNAAQIKMTGLNSTTAFQTPLATLHKWNGWADIFLVTPTNGLADAYTSLGYTKSKIGPFDSLGATLIYHDYHADIGAGAYGREWDAQLRAIRSKYVILIKYAGYTATGFATNTRKFWVSLEWKY
ncbi:MAG: alginate export family protein, partial [Alphaproteobacteria bacterium]|nr:alginate export family protein [Alphaproteobacteria bacterium]